MEGGECMGYADTIAGGLRAQRAKANISQNTLAETIGCSVATIGNWENRAGISLEDAWKLADYYGVSLDELACRKFPA